MTLPPLHCSTASATPFTTKTACRSRLSKLASGTVPDFRAVPADQLAAAANEERQPTDEIYSWLLLAGGHLTRRLFGSMLRRIAALPLLTDRKSGREGPRV